ADTAGRRRALRARPRRGRGVRAAPAAAGAAQRRPLRRPGHPRLARRLRLRAPARGARALPRLHPRAVTPPAPLPIRRAPGTVLAGASSGLRRRLQVQGPSPIPCGGLAGFGGGRYAARLPPSAGARRPPTRSLPLADKPTRRPARPHFSSGPCAKRPGWSLDALKDALVGRSHRAKAPKARLQAVIERSRALLGMPDDWKLAIVPGSDTGAGEMALWSLLGPRPVDVLAWESFGQEWVTDVTTELRLDARALTAPYGWLPDLGAVDWTRDVVFPWNGTTSGVRVPHGDWIAPDREGLAICDATSA